MNTKNTPGLLQNRWQLRQLRQQARKTHSRKGGKGVRAVTSTRSCLYIFEKAAKDRLKYPLPFGAYKLRESRERLEMYRKEVAKIGAIKRGECGRFELMHCTSMDAGHWLKGMPGHIAHRLGYELIPGVEGLVHDGVDGNLVAQKLKLVKGQVAQLVERCESVRSALKCGIGIEYDRMLYDEGLVEPLFTEAIAIADDALSLLHLHEVSD